MRVSVADLSRAQDVALFYALTFVNLAPAPAFFRRGAATIYLINEGLRRELDLTVFGRPRARPHQPQLRSRATRGDALAVGVGLPGLLHDAEPAMLRARSLPSAGPEASP
jgi:hypothetical protein